MNSQRVLPVVGSRRITSQVSVRRLGIAAWGAGSMASLLVAIFLFSRRAVGALAAIHWETVVAVCLITVMTTALGRAVLRRYSPFGGSRRAMCMAWSTATLTTVVAVMLVASPPRTLPEGLLLHTAGRLLADLTATGLASLDFCLRIKEFSRRSSAHHLADSAIEWQWPLWN